MALTPNQWQQTAAEMQKLFFTGEIRLLKAISKRLASDMDSRDWANMKYAQRQAIKREARAVVNELTAAAKALYRAQLEAAYARAAQAASFDLGKLLTTPVVTVSPARSYRLQAVMGELESKMQDHYLRILRGAEDTYFRIIGRAIAESQAGSVTLHQSVQRSLTEFAAHGVRGFTDSAGRAWGMSEYAEMATRAGMMNAALAGYVDAALANGHDLVLVTDHSDECPLCAPWENKVLSLTGLMEDHPDCDGTMDDAREAGLFHPNCLHSFTIYIPGLTQRGGGDRQTAAENKAGYQNRQQQRYMERQVRAWKRKQAVALDPFEERKCKAYVDRWQEKLRGLISKTGLPRDYGREGRVIKLSNLAKAIPASLSKGLSIGRGVAGIPKAITVGASLNNRQKAILANLNALGSTVIIGKKDVTIRDIAALTAYTGNEFAMLTNGNVRQIMRGNSSMVPIYESDAKKLGEEGWRFTAHSHVGADIASLIPSDGDFKILLSFGGKRSIIVNSQGDFRDFKIK